MLVEVFATGKERILMRSCFVAKLTSTLGSLSWELDNDTDKSVDSTIALMFFSEKVERSLSESIRVLLISYVLKSIETSSRCDFKTLDDFSDIFLSNVALGSHLTGAQLTTQETYAASVTRRPS